MYRNNRSNMSGSSWKVLFRFMLPVILVAVFLGCSSSSNSSPTAPPVGGQNTVTMQNTAFSPQSITVTVGTTVTWTNKDPFPHTVTSGTPGSPDGMFNSGNIAPNGSFSHTFNTAGTFHYYCTIHQPNMTGTVIVQAAGGGGGGGGGGGY